MWHGGPRYLSLEEDTRLDDRAADDALMAAMAEGDNAALAEVLSAEGDRVAALARRMLGPGGDVDDLVQEVFLRLWRAAPRWEPGRARISTWLHRVAANLCIDRLRKMREAPLEDAPEVPDRGPAPDAGLVAGAAASLIDTALAALAPRQRLAITLCHYQELGNIEAAEVMGISVEALESLLSRGRRSLKAALLGERDWLMDVVAEGHFAALCVTEDGADG